MSGTDLVWLGPDDPDQGITAERVGSKAAGLWRIGRLGLPTPAAFALPTDLCLVANNRPEEATARIAAALRAGIQRLEATTRRRLGDPRAPLLVSVRSGAAVSMPGMLSTVLNVGAGPETTHGLIRLTGDPRFAWDSYRRFLESYGAVVAGAPPAAFGLVLAAMVRAEGCVDEGDLDGEALERLAAQYAELPAREGSGAIPAEPMDQLVQAALAVFRSWEGHKARDYRRLNGLDGLAGTAVTVQQMVFGNGGPRSGSGVAFSRDPATGAKGLYVDFLFDAQGEDVVSGRRTPAGIEALASRLPSVATALTQGAARLEQAFGDAQDVEFTVEDGELYFLQTRAAKRTPRAALRIAVDLVREGMIDEAEALARLDGVDLACTAVTRFAEPAEAVARGVPAAPGVASGRVAFNVAAAQRLAETGDPVILIRREPATEDIAGFAAAAGILTAVGGRTAHAAVVARQMARACVVGCAGLAIDEAAGSASLAGRRIAAGDWISLDGESGEVSLGRRQIVSDAPAVELATVAAWRAARSDCTGAPAGETQAGQPAALSQ